MNTAPELETTACCEEGVRMAYGVGCRMRDGVSLACDIYFPMSGGPFPVLLMRQPYGKDIASTVVYAQPTWFCRRGFIVVIQDVRGRGESEGDFNAFVNEANDGVDTIEWASRLPNCNGSVGMYGFSYQGCTQLLAARERPNALKAIAPHMTAFDLYSGWFYRSGMLQHSGTLGWGNQMLREDARRAGHWELYRELEKSYANVAELVKSQPIASVKPLTEPEASSYLRDWLEHEEYDSYWDSLNVLNEAGSLSEIPCFHLSGWYDYYLRGSMDGYKALAAISPEKQKLVIGPWTHIPWGGHVAGHWLGETARYPVDEALAEWMLKWCTSEGQTDISSVDYFSMGDNAWHSSEEWPPADVKTIQWFLSSSGGANSIYGDGELSTAAESVKTVADRFVYDPEVPVVAPGFQGGGIVWGPVNILPMQQGNNLLIYRTLPFENSRRFAGSPLLRLFVKTSVVETAFVAKISLQNASASTFISLGANQTKNGKKYDDGSIELLIEIDDCAFQVKVGERLVLDICSSAYPLLARHPNTAESINKVAGPEYFKRAVQVILHDPFHPSNLSMEEVIDG